MLLPSRPEEFHPEPLTEPHLTLSRLPREGCRLPLNIGFLPLPVDLSQMAMTAPLTPRALHPLHRYYEAVRPCPAHPYFQPRGWSRLCLFPWHRQPGSHVRYKSLVEKPG
jgi:hypothetical protein